MINTIGVIGVAVAIGTVLAAFGALYLTWWLAGSVDVQQSQIADLYKQDEYMYSDLNKEIIALKSEITNLNNQINELKK